MTFAAAVTLTPGTKVRVVGFPTPLTVKAVVSQAMTGWKGDRAVVTLVDAQGNEHTRYQCSLIRTETTNSKKNTKATPKGRSRSR